MELLLAEFIDGNGGGLKRSRRRWLTNRELEPGSEYRLVNKAHYDRKFMQEIKAVFLCPASGRRGRRRSGSGGMPRFLSGAKNFRPVAGR
jgi:hypothetical protein